MFNLNNVNGFVSANNFISIVGNRYGNEYTADALSFQVGLLNGGFKIQFGSSYSVKVGADLQLGILSGLTESILAMDATPIHLNDTNTYYVRGLADIVSVHGGNGVSGLTTSDAFKKKLNIPTTFDSALIVPGKETTSAGGSSTSASNNKYSTNENLVNFFSRDIEEFNSKCGNINADTTGEEDKSTNPSIDTLKNFVSSNRLFTETTLGTLDSISLNDIRALKQKVEALGLKDSYDHLKREYSVHGDDWASVLKSYLQFDKDDASVCEKVKDITSESFDAGAGSRTAAGSTSTADVTLKVYQKTGTADVSMSTLVSGSGMTQITFTKVKTDGTEQHLSEADFFARVVNSEIEFDNTQSKAIFLIGLFSERKSTVSRSVSLAFIPQFEIGATYSALSVQGISFDQVGIVFRSPILSMISENVNNWSFSVVQPFAANITRGSKSVKTAVNEFSVSVLGVNSDKSIADEVFNRNTTDAFQKEVSNSCIKPFASEDDTQWFVKNNYNGSFFAKLNNPLFNLLTGFQVNLISKGKHTIYGFSVATVYSFIKLV